MVFLVSFANIRAAYAFADYLTAQGIHNQLDVCKDSAGIYLNNEAELEAAKKELVCFLENPGDRRYQQASWQLEKTGNNEALETAYANASVDFWKNIKAVGLVTKLIAIICVVIYVISDGGQDRAVIQDLFYFTNTDQLISMYQPWRIFTPIFLHFTILHLVFNVLWWWYLGDLIEGIQSSTRLLILVVLVGALSNTVQFFVAGSGFGGLSGVVYGLLGYLWIYGYMHPKSGLRIGVGIVYFMLAWLVLGFTGWAGPVANGAHVAGLVSGCMFGALYGLVDEG